MLTLQKLKDLKPGIFASGTTIDSPEGANMMNTGKVLKWVAVRGQFHDWAIYCQYEGWTDEQIRDVGEKVHTREYVIRLVPCDKKALAMYRD